MNPFTEFNEQLKKYLAQCYRINFVVFSKELANAGLGLDQPCCFCGEDSSVRSVRSEKERFTCFCNCLYINLTDPYSFVTFVRTFSVCDSCGVVCKKILELRGVE
jgi:hypothetical protein